MNADKGKKRYVLSLSYGKDSMACLGAIEHLGWPLDRIVTADVWATDTIPAEHPVMTAWTREADEKIKARYGLCVEHYTASRVDGEAGKKVSYRDGFYHKLQSGKFVGAVKGWPMQRGPWCQKLKLRAVREVEKSILREACGADVVWYLGIAADEPERIKRHIGRPDALLPLVEIGWEEELCGLWSKYNGLLSPSYEFGSRDGCWFCHNQGVAQLRALRHEYPELWELMLKWDADSPVPFKSGGRSVRDYDLRFALEDEGVIDPDKRFFWRMLDAAQLRLF